MVATAATPPLCESDERAVGSAHEGRNAKTGVHGASRVAAALTEHVESRTASKEELKHSFPDDGENLAEGGVM